MKRSFKKTIQIAALTLILFTVSAQSGSLKQKILNERLEKEKGELSLAIKVSMQEKDVVDQMAFNTLLKVKKLKLLLKSSDIMKENCLFFDMNCKKIYNMSCAYLTDEIRKTEKELKQYEMLVEESQQRLNELNEKMALIEKGVEVEISSVIVKPAIPELNRSFKCADVSGWNKARGVFVKPEEIKDFPFSVFVNDIIKMKNGGYLITVEAGKYKIHFSYVLTPAVKKGEITGLGKKIFSGSAGNPVRPGYVLVFITKDGKFASPGFLCR